MEEDTETLDWGQEEEEQQANLRKASFDQNIRREYGDADDIEDTVSLGEDEEEPMYYNQQQDATRSAREPVKVAEVPERPPSSQRSGDNSGANDHRDYRYNSRDAEPLESSASRDSRMSPESPPRHRHSAHHRSPQRYQQNGARITHALPPKPALAQVPYLPPSHPSMVEAIGMASTSISPPSRSTIRDSKKLNGTPGRPGSSPMPAELPADWERRYSRNGGHMYYYHLETEETTWDFPVSSLPSTSTLGGSQRRRRLSASSGHMHLTSPDSNTHHSQTSRSKRQHSHPRADNELKDQPNPPTPDPDGLSYEDRHYRPGGEAPSASLEIKVPERLDGPAIRPHAKSRYDRSPSPRQRRRPRSIPPPPSDFRGPRGPANEKDYPSTRGNGRPVRDRNVYTNPEPVLHRDIDAMPPQSEFSDRHWEPSPHAPVSDFSRNERGPRRPPHRDEDDFVLESRSSDNRNRVPLRRRESSRGPRDREPPRPTDRRDKPSESQNFISAPRYRSPPRSYERDQGRDQGRNLGPPPPEVGAYSGPPPQTRRERERPSRFGQFGPNGPPPPDGPPSRGESYNGRPRNYDMPPDFNHPRHREERGRERERERERDVDRGRRDLPPDDTPSIRLPPNSYSGERNRMPVDRVKRFADDNNQVRPEESSHHRRVPLPPQTKTFTTSTVPGHENDPIPYAPGWAHKDPTVPKEPRYTANEISRSRGLQPQQDRLQSIHNSAPQRPPPVNSMPNDYDRQKLAGHPIPSRPFESREYPGPSEGSRFRRDLSPPRHALNNAPRQIPSSNAPPRGSDSRMDSHRHPPGPGLPPQSAFGDRRDHDGQHDGRPHWKDSRPPLNMYPERNPPPPRRDIPARPPIDGPRRPSSGPVSGTNNVPIGSRRTGPQGHATPPLPPPPPPSVPEALGLMRPTFNPDARPPPSTLLAPFKNGLMGTIRAGEHDNSGVPGSTQETAPARPKRRESRFSPIEPRVTLPDAQKGRIPDKYYPQAETQATPPPISRDPSAMSVTSDHLPTRSSDRGQPPDDRFDEPRVGRSREVSGSSSLGASSSTQNPSLRAESSQAASSFEKITSKETSRPNQQQQYQRERDRGPSKWGPEIKQPNDQSSEMSNMQSDSPPSLARRMSSERPPRLRKYSSATTNEHDSRASNASPSTYPPPPDPGMQASDDLKDRLDSNRPTLLDRLQTAPASESDHGLPSLRDRLVPSKRDRDDMEDSHPRESSHDNDDGNENKRARRRNTKNKRGGGGGRRIVT